MAQVAGNLPRVGGAAVESLEARFGVAVNREAETAPVNGGDANQRQVDARERLLNKMPAVGG